MQQVLISIADQEWMHWQAKGDCLVEHFNELLMYHSLHGSARQF
jgi:hypothetical protein